MLDRAKAVQFANDNWFRPCPDGDVWTANYPVKWVAEARQRKLNPADWAGIFLNYDSGTNAAGQRTVAEGLYLVPAAEGTEAVRVSRSGLSKNYPTKHFLVSWPDAGIQSADGQTPQHTGLNDCTHFTSGCLVAGGLPVANLGAGQFVNTLRARGDVKTLCYQVDKELARRIINNGPLAPGDVVAFSHTDGFHHAILYLGDRKVAAHTHSNHPKSAPDNHATEPDKKTNNWEVSANPSHPQVTLLHFTAGDLDLSHTPWVPGWWLMTWRGQPYFYLFEKSGRVTWTQKPPASTTAPAPAQPGGAGYWFARTSTAINICWSRTGTFEHLDQRGALAGEGTSNGEPLAGVRLTI